MKTLGQRAIPFLAALAVLAWPWLPLPMRYQANDDLGIIAFLSRGFDPVFFSVLLGKLLQAGYRLWGESSPVYPLFLNACLAACAFVFCRVILGVRDLPFRLVALAVYAVVFVYFAFVLTFTMVAGALAAHGMLLLVTSSRPRDAVLAGGFCGLGALIRLDAALLCLILSGVPALAWILPLRRERLRAAGLALAPVALLLGGEHLVQRFGVSAAHREFVAFNQLRGRLHGFPILDAQRGNADLLRANQWTAADYELFVEWTFPDERKFNARTLANVFTIPAPPVGGAVQTASPSPGERLRTFPRQHLACLGAFGLLVVLALTSARPRNALWLAAHAVVFLALCLVLAGWLRFPIRVRESAILAALLGGLALHLDAPPVRGARLLALRLALPLFLAWRGWTMLSHALTLRWDQAELGRGLAHLNRAYPGHILYFWNTFAPNFELLHPVRPPRREFHLMLYGWSTFSEMFYQDIHRRLGIRTGAELLPALASRDDVVFVAPASGLRLLAQSLRESHGLTRTPRLLETLDGVPYWKLE